MSEQKLNRLISAAIAEIHRGDLTGCRTRLLEKAESDSGVSKAKISAAVRKAIKDELPDDIAKELKKQIKSEDTEKLISVIVGKVLAKFFELMFTRKSQWQSQLKGG